MCDGPLVDESTRFSVSDVGLCLSKLSQIDQQKAAIKGIVSPDRRLHLKFVEAN